MIFTEKLSGRGLSLYPGPKQDQAEHISGTVTREGSVAAVLVSSEERYEIRLRTSWGQTPLNPTSIWVLMSSDWETTGWF